VQTTAAWTFPIREFFCFLPYGFNMKLHAFPLLYGMYDAEQIIGCRVPSRTEHSHEAFRRFIGEKTQFFKA
jgi:hypothetical protein